MGKGRGVKPADPPDPRLQLPRDRRRCLHSDQTLGRQTTGVSPRLSSGKLERALGEGQRLLDWTALGTCVRLVSGVHRELHPLRVSPLHVLPLHPDTRSAEHPSTPQGSAGHLSTKRCPVPTAGLGPPLGSHRPRASPKAALTTPRGPCLAV